MITPTSLRIRRRNVLGVRSGSRPSQPSTAVAEKGKKPPRRWPWVAGTATVVSSASGLVYTFSRFNWHGTGSSSHSVAIEAIAGAVAISIVLLGVALTRLLLVWTRLLSRIGDRVIDKAESMDELMDSYQLVATTFLKALRAEREEKASKGESSPAADGTKPSQVPPLQSVIWPLSCVAARRASPLPVMGLSSLVPLVEMTTGQVR